MADFPSNESQSEKVITEDDLSDKATEEGTEFHANTTEGDSFSSLPNIKPLANMDKGGQMDPAANSPLPSEDTASCDKSKVDLLLKAVGDAPIMKKKRWAVEPSKKVAWVSEFVRKYLKCEPNESLFLYVNQYFSPSPDQEVGSLYECFGSDGKLVLHYCKQQAWG